MSNNDEKRVFIDEDWKEQVRREKEEALLKNQQDAEQRNTQSVAESLNVDSADKTSLDENVEIDASFANLVASLAAQAMFALGVIAPQGAQQVTVNLDQAKFFLDTLTMLKSKTKGNLNKDEEHHLAEALSEMEQVYEARLYQIQEQTLLNNGIDVENIKNPLSK